MFKEEKETMNKDSGNYDKNEQTSDFEQRSRNIKRTKWK